MRKFQTLVLKNSLSALVIVKVVPISSELELQLKNWVLELELEPSVLWELSQDRGSDSAFRKGLVRQQNDISGSKTFKNSNDTFFLDFPMYFFISWDRKEGDHFSVEWHFDYI